MSELKYIVIEGKDYWVDFEYPPYSEGHIEMGREDVGGRAFCGEFKIYSVTDYNGDELDLTDELKEQMIQEILKNK
jgi:hypothetical protein